MLGHTLHPTRTPPMSITDNLLAFTFAATLLTLTPGLDTAAELEYVRTGGRAARDGVVARLQAAWVGHASCVYRESLV